MLFRDRLRRLARLGLAASERLGGVVPLFTRIVIGYAFARTGFGKWSNFDTTIGYFGELGFPLPGLTAALVASAELVGGVALVVGLWTRAFAATLSVVMGVALVTADRAQLLASLGGGDTSLLEVTPFVFLVFLLWIAAHGAGGISLDRLLREGRPEVDGAWRRRLAAAGDRLIPLVPLLTRLVVGYTLCTAGLGKLRGFEHAVDYFRELGLPAPALTVGLTAGLELLGGAALVLGLGTRLFSALLGVTMIVALTTAERMKLITAAVPGGTVGLLDVLPLVLLLGLGWLLARGPGPLSVDRVFYRWLRARRRARAASAERPTRIVVVGGGFAGVYAALELEKAFDDDPDVRITLVSQENFLLFTPMLHEVAASDLDYSHIVSPIRKLLARTELFHGEVLDVDLAAKEVVARHGGDEHVHRIPYDHVVLGLGSVTNFQGVPGLAERALTMKSLGDAIALRNRLITALESGDFDGEGEARARSLTFVVAGGGFAGVETIAAMNDFAREVRRFYPRIPEKAIRMVLVHSGKRLLPELSESLGRYAERKLVERGVEVRLGTRVRALTKWGVELADETVIPTRTLVWTAGTAANPLTAALPCKTERGRLVVDASLRVEGYEGVWALGDCAMVPDVLRGGFCPPTAQHASRQGKAVARNIAAVIRGQRLRPFRFRMVGQMASLGRRSGVASLFGLRFSGFVAWWLWRSIYLSKLPGFERKVRVALDWTLDLFFTKDLVECPADRRSGVRPALAPPQAHVRDERSPARQHPAA